MSDAVLKTTEDAVVGMVASAFMGEAAEVAAGVPTDKEQQFEFEADFQSKIAAFSIRDKGFLRRCLHLLRPEFFENVGEAALVNIVIRHAKKFNGDLPDRTAIVHLFAKDIKAKVIRGEAVEETKKALKALFAEPLENRELVEESVAQFAKHQAIGAAMMKSIELRDRGEFEQIEKLMTEACSIGLEDDAEGYDYLKRIDERTATRLDIVSGKRVPQGITTGIPKMDALLYHRGWGRKELATIMGGAKAGKTTALINFAKAGAMAGHNVLYVTLEVGKGVIGDRLDACISETLMKELTANIHGIREKIEAIDAKSGRLIIHEYASGTLSNLMLRKLINRYKTPGHNADGSARLPIIFDLVVVDYADIMAPDFRTQDAIENSKSVYVGLRAIAFDENVAMLTATQTNRTGHTAAVAKAEHVAEDFNKVRTVDLMISINKTEEEAKRGEARLYFAASRNQESGFTILIRQRMDMMKFVDEVLGVE